MSNRLINKEELNMDTMYHSIWQFREASLALSEPRQLKMNGNTKFLFVPAMVNLAFECEIEMKYLILNNQSSVIASHDLLELFKLLPNEIKTICYSICDEGEDFYQILDEYKNTFDEFRYDFQYGIKSPFEKWFLRRLSNCLFDLIKK